MTLNNCQITCNVACNENRYVIETETTKFNNSNSTEIDKHYQKLVGDNMDDLYSKNTVSLESENLSEIKETVAKTILSQIKQAVLTSLAVKKIELNDTSEDSMFFTNEDLEQSSDIFNFIQNAVALKDCGAEIVGLNI